MADRPMHTLQVVTTFDDGHQTRWSYPQPGTADDAHAALVRRWRALGKTFERDRTAHTLTRRYDDPEIGCYVDVITHIPEEDPDAN